MIIWKHICLFTSVVVKGYPFGDECLMLPIHGDYITNEEKTNTKLEGILCWISWRKCYIDSLEDISGKVTIIRHISIYAQPSCKSSVRVSVEPVHGKVKYTQIGKVETRNFKSFRNMYACILWVKKWFNKAVSIYLDRARGSPNPNCEFRN